MVGQSFKIASCSTETTSYSKGSPQIDKDTAKLSLEIRASSQNQVLQKLLEGPFTTCLDHEEIETRKKRLVVVNWQPIMMIQKRQIFYLACESPSGWIYALNCIVRQYPILSYPRPSDLLASSSSPCHILCHGFGTSNTGVKEGVVAGAQSIHVGVGFENVLIMSANLPV